MTAGSEAADQLPPCRPLDEARRLNELETECARLRLLLALAEAPNLRASLGWEPEPFVRLPGMLAVTERSTR